MLICDFIFQIQSSYAHNYLSDICSLTSYLFCIYFVIPSPTWASCIMLTSLAPSPMAAVTGVWSATFISFTTYKVTAISYKESDWSLRQSQGHDLSSTKENCFLGNYGYIATYVYNYLLLHMRIEDC